MAADGGGAAPATKQWRSPGRPRSQEADEAILSAAVDLLIERGVGQTSIEQVARRAGVTRATVYRRFAHLTALLVRAVEWEYRDFDPDRLRWSNVEDLVIGLARHFSQPRARRLMRRLYGAVDDLPELLRAYAGTDHDRHLRTTVRAVLERARADGQFPKDSDARTLGHILNGAALHHLGGYPDTTSETDLRSFFLAILKQAGYRPAPSHEGVKQHE
jgi:AcrR family transcriptional regulator